jgi:hypothetical protein
MQYSLSLDVGSTDSEIQPLLAMHGYPVERIKTIRSRWKKVSSLISTKSKVHGGQLEVSQDFQTRHESAKKCYRETSKIARELFKDNPKATSALMLNGRRKKTISGWKSQTETFYTHLLTTPEFMSIMAGHGYSETKLS